jgi:hypothetical protein
MIQIRYSCVDITLSSTFFFFLLPKIVNFKFNAIVINENLIGVLLCTFDYNYYISSDSHITVGSHQLVIDQRET